MGRDDHTGDSSRNLSPVPSAFFLLPSERQKVTSSVTSPCCEVRGYIRKLTITRHSSQADLQGPPWVLREPYLTESHTSPCRHPHFTGEETRSEK